MAHCLAVADAHLALLQLSRNSSVELLTVATDPACWRRYLGAAGSRETVKPDLYAVTASGEFEDHWFIEVDRGFESLPTLLGKCAQYESYRQSGTEQAEHGVFPLVVWIVPTERHVARLSGALHAARSISPDHFRVCTLDSFPGVVAQGAA